MTITETLNRLVEAQQLAYASALNETRGAERSHWILFVYLRAVGAGRFQGAPFRCPVAR